MPLRVRYQECDGQGIVFNANYLAYIDMASFEMDKALFGSHAEFKAFGVDMVVAEANVKYLAPCRFEDDLVVSARISRIGTTSLIVDFEIHRGDRQVTTAKLRYVFIDPVTFRPTPAPEQLRKIYEAQLPA
ncbi:thioesterase family protein [Amycolatopsis sp.]|jgi:acyl-CoA thioester hydrolase|uniref:acyl-CoA thioesterase n=1 Tax=Amycolatopsis sp. TaxID=37632 RepID=UPI002DFB46A0|nr:thioesterase family protein [Amycolatopsis sp.]